MGLEAVLPGPQNALYVMFYVTNTVTKIQPEINLVQSVVTNKAYIQLAVKPTVTSHMKVTLTNQNFV